MFSLAIGGERRYALSANRRVLAAIRAEGDAKFARLMRSSVFERDVADARTWLIEAR